MIPLHLTNGSGRYTLELVFSIRANHSLGLQSASVAVYTVWMYRSAGQPPVRDSDLLVDRGYDTEDADPQLGTDEEVDTQHRGRPLGAVQLTRVRHLSPAGERVGSSRVMTVSRVDRNFGGVQRCLIVIPGCFFAARVSEGHDFCSETCNRLVCIWLDAVYSKCLSISLFVCPQRLDGGEFRTSRPEIVEAKCLNPACGRMNRFTEGHQYCGLKRVSS